MWLRFNFQKKITAGIACRVAARLLSNDLHVCQKSYSLRNVYNELTSHHNLVLIEKTKFNAGEFEDYRHRKGVGRKADSTYDMLYTVTYKFRLKDDLPH
ncbi:hypothetical protein E3N88_08930 [Mikania micrantha]|uniref:Uncharacterized protein n=1 Tax=Mikania micrantha TaxID=192012 RepID=A0A5N6PHQ6_9ASTR|nr:hypothetical protein E3N88_08930 [Mikania micrantha]